MTYTSSDQLKDRTLSIGDIIIFEVDGAKIEYTALPSYLYNPLNANDYIFKILDIEDKASFCKECYKYEPDYGNVEDVFPECKTDDWKALTSVAFALLKLCEEKKYKNFFTFTDTDIPDNYPYNYAILDLSIQEDKNQHPNLTLLECFNRCISTSISGLFLFQSSIMGNDFWVKVVENRDKSYIPKMYEPKYYSPTSLLKKDANSSETLTSNLDYDNGLDKSSLKKELERKELNISIPCSYEEVKLSIKKSKIKF